ncbi:Hypothetical protein A7982_02049 [Minicystis rosea]|nr:Hypothetical protein A7982_02049 [Minicystis rosea]
MAIVDYFAAVPPGGYAIVPNPERRRILYTTSLASCLGLVILKPGAFAVLAHVVSTPSTVKKDYYEQLLLEISSLNGGLDGLSILVAPGEMGIKYPASEKAYLHIKKIFGDSVTLTKGSGSTLLFNTLTGIVLNKDPHSGPEMTELVKGLRSAINKQTFTSYDKDKLYNIMKSGGDATTVADALQDLTTASATASKVTSTMLW